MGHSSSQERWNQSREAGRAADSAPRANDAPLEHGAAILRALSHPARLKIIQILAGGEVCVKGLEEVLGLSQPSVSQHLARLKYAGLIESERKGHLVCYRIRRGTAPRILDILLEEAGDDAPEDDGTLE